jgi:hypothetical protein
MTGVRRTQDDIVTDPKQFAFFGDFSGADDALEVRSVHEAAHCHAGCTVTWRWRGP